MDKRPFNKLVPILFEQVQITDEFWSKRQKINRNVSIHFQHQKLEDYRHIDNFRVAARVKKGIHRGLFYFDSDLYKWLEAACYILNLYEDAELENKVDEIVDLIVKAQKIDGYLNTYYSIFFIDKRLTNLLFLHELYCMGHLFQAAAAHYKATGKDILLKVADKCVDLLLKMLNMGKLKGAPGHPEIELALIELFRITYEKKYLNLAKTLIERRGNISHFKTLVIRSCIDIFKAFNKAKKITIKFEKFNEDRYNPEKYSPKMSFYRKTKGFVRFTCEILNGKYAQLKTPVSEETEPVGHSVRAMYLYSAIADLYSEMGDKSLLKALELIWLKMVKARMYITGGVGSICVLEGFGKDFELNNEGSYSETCAAIGNMMWNWRMLQITGKARYADLIEKLLYNAMLVGQSIDGRKFTYNNPLVSRGDDERKEWFYCACCPPNIARTIISLGQYIYSTSKKGVWIHQYIGSEASIEIGQNKTLLLKQESQFPWNGNVIITLNIKSNQDFSLFLRIPAWSNETVLKINNEKYQDGLAPGKYAEISRNWSDGDIIEIRFAMTPRLETSDPQIKNNRNRVAISNGPLIYCLEEKDNPDINIFKELISKNQELKVRFNSELLGGINIIHGSFISKKRFVAIPYYLWCNRGPSKMLIWNKIERNYNKIRGHNTNLLIAI